VPIVVLTAQNDDASITQAYEVRATDFIAKPISWQLLNHRVRYLLRSSAALENAARSEASLAHAQALAQLGSWEWHTSARHARWSTELSASSAASRTTGSIRWRRFFTTCRRTTENRSRAPLPRC